MNPATIDEVEFKRLLRRLFGVNEQSRRRQDALKRIEALGFKLVDLRGWHEGKHAPRRYHLIAPSGEVLDNNGEGYYSTSAAHRAARQAASSQKSQ